MLLSKFVPSRSDLDHVSKCRLARQDCPTCLFLMEKTCRGRPWLCKGPLGFGCSVCQAAKVSHHWGCGTVDSAKALKKQNLDRHEQSWVHQLAARKEDIIDGVRVPVMKVFKDMWKAMEEGNFSCVALAHPLH